MRPVTSGGDPAPLTLEYAARRRWSRRRTVVASLAVATLLAAAGAWRSAPAIRDRVNLLHAQRRCLTYAAPADRVVFSNHREELDALRDADAAYRVGHQRASPDGGIDAFSYAWYSVDAWRALPAGRWEPGPAFLHGRRTPGGERRLVALELSVIGDQLIIYCRSFKPASLSDEGDVARRTPRSAPGVYRILRMGEPVRLFAGQPDANDASRFTVRCESRNESATIRGQVHDDGRVSLAVTDGWLLDRWADRKAPAPTIFSTAKRRAASTRSLIENRPTTAGY